MTPLPASPHWPSEKPPRVAAVILAGGEGSRLGGAVKANLSVGGVRLLERVAAALTSIPGPILVACGRFDPALLRLRPDMVAIPDVEGPVRGPLAGLAAAALWCRTQVEPPELVLSVAVDTPFFPADFLDRAGALLTSNIDAVIAHYAGQSYPTNALWRTGALEGLLRTELFGELAPGGIKAFARTLRSRELDWPAGPGGDPFANLNTPEDHLALERRARAERQPASATAPAEIGVGKAGQTR